MENKTETKQWWRQSDTMYNFIMQCAKNDENGAKPYCVCGKLADIDVSASFHANSRNFGNGRMWEVDFSLYSMKKPRNLEELIVKGVNAFGGSKICMASAEKRGGVEISESIAEVKRWVLGFPWVYTAEIRNFEPPHTIKHSKIMLSNKLDLKKAAEAMQGMMEKGQRAHIYADNGGVDSQVIIYANENNNPRPHGIFMRKSRAGRFSDLLTADDVFKFDETASRTGYNFKGKEWNVELSYRK